jgi:hypothetical protein
VSVSDSAFDQPQARLREERARFHASVGRLFLAWSRTEAEIYRVLVKLTGVTDAIGRSIFAGERARTMFEIIDRILENTGGSEVRRADFRFLSAQANAINTLRDGIAHHGDLDYVSMEC